MQQGDDIRKTTGFCANKNTVCLSGVVAYQHVAYCWTVVRDAELLAIFHPRLSMLLIIGRVAVLSGRGP